MAVFNVEKLSSLILRRQTWGPMLVLTGTFVLFFVQVRSSSPFGLIEYVGAGIAILLVLAGIVMMFVRLRGESVSLGLGVAPGRAGEPEHLVVQLSKNYEVLRSQTTQGFILAGMFMALGILVILSGSVGKLFGLVKDGSDLTSIAGVIMEFISGTSIFIYRLNFARLNVTSDRLDASWRVLTAYRLATSLPEDKKAEATLRLIDALILPDEKRAPTGEKDTAKKSPKARRTSTSPE